MSEVEWPRRSPRFLDKKAVAVTVVAFFHIIYALMLFLVAEDCLHAAHIGAIGPPSRGLVILVTVLSAPAAGIFALSLAFVRRLGLRFLPLALQFALFAVWGVLSLSSLPSALLGAVALVFWITGSLVRSWQKIKTARATSH